MMIGTLCFSQSARSCSRRLFDRCTIWLTANGADGRSGWAASKAASSCLIRVSHSSSNSGGRAFSAGNAPTIPALHWAITRSGTETMNNGAPNAGSDRRPLNSAGMDIGENPCGDESEGCPTSYQEGNRAFAQPRYWQRARVTKLLVRQSSGFRVRPGIITLGEQASTESVVRLLPSLKPLAWQSLSAASLQSGAPLAATGHWMRPVAMEAGLARRDRLSPASLAASLARALRSSMVSLGLFSAGRIDSDFSSALPISLSRPGFSGAAGAQGSAGGR